MFTFNEGPLDRALRISGGMVLVWLGALSGLVLPPVSIIATGVGVLMFVTGAVGICPLYDLLGIRTVSS